LVINLDKIRALSSQMMTAVGSLEELGSLPYELLLKDKHKIASVKYNFIIAIEAAIDIANHIISKNRLRSPEDYGDTFKVLREGGIVNEEFATTLVSMARFRNRLVHLYWEVDNKLLIEILKENISDFENYLRQIGNFLKEEGYRL